MRIILSLFFGLVCFSIPPLSTYSQTPVSSPTPQSDIAEADLIHFGDLIDVDFAGTAEYDWRGTLTSGGLLDGLNEFSTFIGLCRSGSDIASDIASVYSKFLREPKVTVRIIDRSNRAVARLEGAIKTPTRFRILRPVHIRELVVAAGGLTDYASGGITILRPADLNCSVLPVRDSKGPSGNGLQTINISISDLLSGKESADPVILSGDIVTVEKAFPIYVIGAVNNPRAIYTRSGMTLTRAIASAGGIVKGAEGDKIAIFRRDNADTTVIHADMEKIRKGEIVDVDLKPFDIIDVAFKGRASRKYPPVIAAGDAGDRTTSELPLRIID